MPIPQIRQATLIDLPNIITFVDFWLTGGGIKVKAPGAVHDCLVTPSMHTKYIQRYTTWLLTSPVQIIGWAVLQKDQTLIHFLISGYHRGQGFGSFFLRHLNPPTIRSKADQSSGDPGPFYERLGYVKTATVQSRPQLTRKNTKTNRPKNINIYSKSTTNPAILAKIGSSG